MSDEQPTKSQSDKFKDTAREAGCDQDDAGWADSLEKVAKRQPEKSR